jgi:chromosome segregation ATPase
MVGNGHRAITLGSENENLKEKYKPLFKDLKIVIAYDNDEAGRKGTEKILQQLQGVAKEIKVWNWDKIEKNQDLTLFKGFDMTDYLSEIKKLNLEFDKTNYQEDFNNEVLKMKKEDLVRAVEIINSNDEELNNISKKLFFFEDRMINFKSNKFQKKDKNIKIELEKEKDNTDFLKKVYKVKSDLSPNIQLDNDFEQNLKKAENIESGVENIKDESEKVDIKIDQLNSNLSQTEKNKLFEEIEKDILNLKSAVEKLKEENQNLKKELALLSEKNKIESQKSNLEKENSNLKDKLEALKNKTQNSKNEFESDSKNKITYKDKPESQAIKDYENLNDNQKEM